MPDSTESIYPTFRPRLPWIGGDLQTVRNSLRRPQSLMGSASTERLWFDTGDGTGDRLTGMLHRPAVATDRPVCILVHGLTGCEDSYYMHATGAQLLSAGHPVLRLNLRGAGPSAAHCRLRYHAGRSEDLRAVVERLDPTLARNGIVLIGYSLGGNVVLKFLGEEGESRRIRAGVVVSAPVDLSATAVHFARRRNLLYQRHLLTRMKALIVPPTGADDWPLRQAVLRARTVYEFDDIVVAPWNGFRDAEDYYARSMGLRFAGGVRVPTLLLQAEDDPWIPVEPVRRYPWAQNPCLKALISPGGGHVGFHMAGGETWHDACIGRFLSVIETGGGAREAAAAAQLSAISRAASSAP